MNEKELADQIKAFQEAKKQNKDVDISSLALHALQSFESNSLTSSEKRWAYLISIGIPPVGLFFAAKFYISGKTDGKQAAYMCIALTAITIIGFFLIMKVMFAGSGTSVQQIEQIKPRDVQDLLQ